MSFDWTAERIDLLDYLWNKEKLSGTEIANRLGGGLSRSAVIGKIDRLKLSTRPKKVHGIGPRNKRKSRAKTLHCVVVNRPPEKTKTVAVPRRAPKPAYVSNGKHCTLMMLTDQTCKWPMGDPLDREQFHFCGLPPKPNAVYCDYHYRLAFQPYDYRLRHDERVCKGTALCA